MILDDIQPSVFKTYCKWNYVKQRKNTSNLLMDIRKLRKFGPIEKVKFKNKLRNQRINSK